MSPQLVDLNGDGHDDLVAGTFRGWPSVAWGSAAGFATPVPICDRNGDKITMRRYHHKGWTESDRCDPVGRELRLSHLTSAVAYDWDADGDLDLLLGDHSSGYVMLRINEAFEAGDLVFATRNQVILAGDEPLQVEGTVATLQVVDFDRDGLDDLLVGSRGGPYADSDVGGGILLYRNVGTGGAPRFHEPTELIPRRKMVSEERSEPERPDEALHMWAVDFDHDGDLDLVVGGRSYWTSRSSRIAPDRAVRIAELEERVRIGAKTVQDCRAAMAKELESLQPGSGDARRREIEAAHAERIAHAERSLESVGAQLDEVRPPAEVRRAGFIWLFENTTKR